MVPAALQFKWKKEVYLSYHKMQSEAQSPAHPTMPVSVALAGNAYNREAALSGTSQAKIKLLYSATAALRGTWASDQGVLTAGSDGL